MNVLDYLEQCPQLPIPVPPRAPPVAAEVGFKNLRDVDEGQSLLEPSLLRWTVGMGDYLGQAKCVSDMPLESQPHLLLPTILEHIGDHLLREAGVLKHRIFLQFCIDLLLVSIDIPPRGLGLLLQAKQLILECSQFSGEVKLVSMEF